MATVVTWRCWVVAMVVVGAVGGHFGRLLLVVVYVDGDGKERSHVTKQTLFVTYALKINNKQINDSSGMLFLPILGNILV